MDIRIKNRLKSIFASKIDKTVDELSPADLKIFDEWIEVGMAGEYIPAIKKELASLEIEHKEEASEHTYKGKTRCRNCDSLVISLVNKKRFGYDTIQVSVYCSYWYNKNSTYKNALYTVNLNDVACTRITYHKNVLDLNNIDLTGVDEIEVLPEDFKTLPIASFIDKGYNLKKDKGVFYLVKGEVDERFD